MSMKNLILSLLLFVSINCFANPVQTAPNPPVTASAPQATSNVTVTVTAHPVVHLSADETIMIGIIMFMFVMFVVEHEEESSYKKKRRR